MGLFNWLFGNSREQRAGAKNAIPVDSVREEYEWVEQNLPGYHPASQALQKIDGKPYDVLTVKNDAGEERTLYFDISSFFGKS